MRVERRAPPDLKDKKHALHTFLDQRAADTGRSQAPLSSNSGPQSNRSRPISHTSQRPATALLLHIASVSPAYPNPQRLWFPRTFVVTFCMRAPHADVYPKLLQDFWEAGDNVHNRATEHRFGIGLRGHPIVQPRAVRLEISPRFGEQHAVSTGLLDAVWPWFASECSHMSPSLPLHKAHVARGPGVKPSRKAVAILHCAFCSISVWDLCITIQVVPVPCPH